MNANRIAVILGTIAATACGGSAGAPSTSASAQDAARSYQSNGQDLAAAITQYQSATSIMPDVTAYRAADATYQAQVGAVMDRMWSASTMMDRYMDDYLGPTAADLGCVANAMVLEYQRHVGVGYGAALPADQTEAAQHIATMFLWMDHQRVRYEQMGAAVGMMPSTTATTWFCRQNADGSFTMGGQTWVPSQTPPAPGTGQNPTPSPAPTPWPMPCGGDGCRCG